MGPKNPEFCFEKISIRDLDPKTKQHENLKARQKGYCLLTLISCHYPGLAISAVCSLNNYYLKQN